MIEEIKLPEDALKFFEVAQERLTDDEAEELIPLSAKSAADVREYMADHSRGLSREGKAFLNASLEVKRWNEKREATN